MGEEDCYEISPSVFSSHWRRREKPHLLDAVATIDTACVALVLANIKGRKGTGKPREGSDEEENNKSGNEHVGVDSMGELVFTVDEGVGIFVGQRCYTQFLYLEVTFLCSS